MPDPVARLNAALEGRYRIESELGEGGMATVYLATDHKHDRKVALKVLKPELAAVLGADRFLAEIRTTANLQHPHILPLHDSGDADGFLFYVMPYVEGESLRSRIDRERQLGVEEALRITRSVAAALGYAHRQGVIHRDVKPANILLHDGEPLVADFGIALAVTAAGAGRMTETGLSLGTPFYMSPEQATADREPGPQSDIYSLACLLYEMLVGDPPHTGSSAQAVLAKILTERPRRVTELRETVPLNVSAALAKALERLPADRFGTTEAFVQALDDAGFMHEPAGGTGATTGAGVGAAVTPGRGAPPRRRWTSGFPWLVAAAAVTVAALSLGDEPVPLQVTRDILTTVEGQEFRELGGSGGLNSTALSPDGRVLVYQGSGASGPSMGVGQLWRRPLDALEATPIPGTEGASTPEFSEDGAFLSFLIRDSDRLGAIPAQGGTPVWLDDSGAFRHAWGDDGAIHWIAGGRLHRWVPGTAEAEVSDYEAGQWRVSDVLPGSRALLVFGEGAIGVLDRASGEGRELGLGLRPKYLADGHIVFAREDGTLLVQPFDTRSLTTTGPAVSTPAVVRRQGGAGAEYAVAPDGTLVYQLFIEESDHRLMWVDRSGRAEAVNVAIPEGAVFDGVSLDPTGLRAAVGIRGSEGGFGQGDIWVLNLEDGTALVLTRDGTSVRPDWHPTEARIAYVGRGDEGPTARWIAADGSGTGEHLVDLNSGAPPQVRWAADGRELLLRMAGVSARSIFRYLPGQGGPPEPWLDGAFNQVDPRPSPDGVWVAYTSDRSGREEVYVRPYAEGGGVTQISTSGGTAPLWSSDGSEIFFGSDGNLWTAAVSADASGFRVDSRVQLFSADDVGDFVGYDVAPGGRFLIVARPPSRVASRGGELVLVRNWVGEVLGGR